VIPGATLTLVNAAQQTTYQAICDSQGRYSFPNLPVGHYDLTIIADGFTSQKKKNLNVDTDSALRLDATLEVGMRSDTARAWKWIPSPPTSVKSYQARR
jgi:hypothetical protein